MRSADVFLSRPTSSSATRSVPCWQRAAVREGRVAVQENRRHASFGAGYVPRRSTPSAAKKAPSDPEDDRGAPDADRSAVVDDRVSILYTKNRQITR